MSYIYSIFDKKSKTFTPPQVHENDGVAVRNLDNYLSQMPKDNLLLMYSDDYAFYKVGVWESFSLNPLYPDIESEEKFAFPNPVFVVELSALPSITKLRENETKTC